MKAKHDFKLEDKVFLKQGRNSRGRTERRYHWSYTLTNAQKNLWPFTIKRIEGEKIMLKAQNGNECYVHYSSITTDKVEAAKTEDKKNRIVPGAMVKIKPNVNAWKHNNTSPYSYDFQEAISLIHKFDGNSVFEVVNTDDIKRNVVTLKVHRNGTDTYIEMPASALTFSRMKGKNMRVKSIAGYETFITPTGVKVGCTEVTEQQLKEILKNFKGLKDEQKQIEADKKEEALGIASFVTKLAK